MPWFTAHFLHQDIYIWSLSVFTIVNLRSLLPTQTTHGMFGSSLVNIRLDLKVCLSRKNSVVILDSNVALRYFNLKSNMYTVLKRPLDF